MTKTNTKKTAVVSLTSPKNFGDEVFEYDPKVLTTFKTKSAKIRYLATLWTHTYDYTDRSGRNVAGVVVKAINSAAVSGKEKVVYQQVRQCLETMMMRK